MADTRSSADDLATLGDRVARGELRTHIDRIFPLEETAVALRYLGDGLVLGKVVVTTG